MSNTLSLTFGLVSPRLFQGCCITSEDHKRIPQEKENQETRAGVVLLEIKIVRYKFKTNSINQTKTENSGRMQESTFVSHI